MDFALSFRKKSKSVCRVINVNLQNAFCRGPGGFVLGPFFFLIYVNDSVEYVVSISRLFIADTCLSFTSSNMCDIDLVGWLFWV